jgi:hypothetical protein
MFPHHLILDPGGIGFKYNLCVGWPISDPLSQKCIACVIGAKNVGSVDAGHRMGQLAQYS